MSIRIEKLKALNEKKDTFFMGRNHEKLFVYTPYWGKIEKKRIIKKMKQIMNIVELNFPFAKFLELWENRQWNQEEKNKEMQQLYNKFRHLLVEKINELQTPDNKGKQMWKIASWLVKKKMLFRDKKGYTPIEVKRETEKAYFVKTKMQLKTTTKNHKIWIPKSQIEEKLDLLKEEE